MKDLPEQALFMVGKGVLDAKGKNALGTFDKVIKNKFEVLIYDRI